MNQDLNNLGQNNSNTNNGNVIPNNQPQPINPINNQNIYQQHVNNNLTPNINSSLPNNQVSLQNQTTSSIKSEVNIVKPPTEQHSTSIASINGISQNTSPVKNINLFQQAKQSMSIDQPNDEKLKSIPIEPIKTINNGSKEQRPKKNKTAIIVAVILIVTIIVGTAILLLSQEKLRGIDSSNVNEIDDISNQELDKEIIADIEQEYKESQNLLQINEILAITESGAVISGEGITGEINLNDIVEFIDSKGYLKRTVVSGIEKFGNSDKVAYAGDNISIALKGVSESDIKLSSIIFKKEYYNGLQISFVGTNEQIKELEDYLDNKTSLDLTINNEVNSASIIDSLFVYESDYLNYLNLSVILNTDNKYSLENSEVYIDSSLIKGEINSILK